MVGWRFFPGRRECFLLVQRRVYGGSVTEAAEELEVPEDWARRWMKPADPDAGR